MRQLNKISVWTIGHSNRSIKYFLDLLKQQGIEVLVDVRRFPTSKVEHFKHEEMEQWLGDHGIEYVWMGEELGGYRRGGYKAYMETEQFKQGIERLLEIVKQKKACIMCLEPNPKYCHRRYISAYLDRKGVNVMHILKKGQTSLMSFGGIA
ncbi:MAG: DUF488 domain-containing protein [Candidatus Bathyarchaeota archaeon]|nr:DUF488 domain-containing protein [Candidatus Bathyarchaeota archaeon]MDH5779486.1 DUF488 domain-containing protein [Candidatus Bathyarchaeota archaeon]